jgi:hypothetical protein
MKSLLLILFSAFSLGAQTVVVGGGGNATSIQSRAMAATAPTDTQTICWDAAASTWKPCAAGAGSGDMLASTYVQSGANAPTNPCATAGAQYIRTGVTPNTSYWCWAAGTNWQGPVVVDPFTQTGTGAVARTFDAEIRDSVKVIQFATCNGTTDDYTALVNANARALAIKATLDFSSCSTIAIGTPYVITVPTAATYVRWEGRGARIKYIGGATTNLLSVDGGTAAIRVFLSDLVLDGNGLATNGLSTYQSYNSVYKNIRVTNVTGTCFQYKSSQLDRIESPTCSNEEEAFTTIPVTGMSFGAGVSTVSSGYEIVINPRIEGVSGTGIECTASVGLNVYGGASQGNAVAFNAGASCVDSVISGLDGEVSSSAALTVSGINNKFIHFSTGASAVGMSATIGARNNLFFGGRYSTATFAASTYGNTISHAHLAAAVTDSGTRNAQFRNYNPGTAAEWPDVLPEGITAASLAATGTVSGTNLVTTAVPSASLLSTDSNGQIQAANPGGAGKIAVGTSGGTTYAPVSVSGDCTLSSAGVMNCTKLNSAGVSSTVAAEMALYEVSPGTDYFSFLAPSALTATTRLRPPNAQPAASTVMLFGAPSAHIAVADGVSSVTGPNYELTSATASFTNVTPYPIYLGGGSSAVTSGWYLATYHSATSVYLDRSPGSATTGVSIVGGDVSDFTYVVVDAASSANTIVRRNGSNEVIAANTVATGQTPTQTVASGALALATSAISSQACQTVTQGSVNSAAATGVATTDVIAFTPNASIKAVTGYAPLTTGGLTIVAYPTSGYVNFDVCNWSASPITPGAVTLNWRVTR